MQNKEEEEQSWIKLTILLLYITVLGFLSFFDGEDGLNFNLDNPRTITILKLLQAFSVLVVFIIPSFLFARFWTKSQISYLGIKKTPKLKTLIISALGMLMALPLINWLAEINSAMKLPSFLSGVEEWMKMSEEKAALLTDALTKGSTIDVLLLNLFVIAFMAAFSEELFFRGIFQKVLNECTKNKHVGVWVGAMVFSAFHMQFYGFLPRMLMGAYLGYLFLWSGSIWPGIFAHFVNNGMAVLLIWLSSRGVIGVDADKVGIQESEWTFVLISILVVVISLIAVNRTEKKTITT